MPIANSKSQIDNRKSKIGNHPMTRWPDDPIPIWVILNLEGFLTPLKVSVLIFRAALFAALLSSIAPGLYSQTSPALPDDVAAEALKFTAVYGAVERNYVD